jgi:hypothetical protein
VWRTFAKHIHSPSLVHGSRNIVSITSDYIYIDIYSNISQNRIKCNIRFYFSDNKFKLQSYLITHKIPKTVSRGMRFPGLIHLTDEQSWPVTILAMTISVNFTEKQRTTIKILTNESISVIQCRHNQSPISIACRASR